MKIERYQCDKCNRTSNGDIGDWLAVRTVSDVMVNVRRLCDVCSDWKHACGEACAMSLVAEAMRGLPK
jgi:hypothetical protein